MARQKFLPSAFCHRIARIAKCSYGLMAVLMVIQWTDIFAMMSKTGENKIVNIVFIT